MDVTTLQIFHRTLLDEFSCDGLKWSTFLRPVTWWLLILLAVMMFHFEVEFCLFIRTKFKLQEKTEALAHIRCGFLLPFLSLVDPLPIFFHTHVACFVIPLKFYF